MQLTSSKSLAQSAGFSDRQLYMLFHKLLDPTDVPELAEACRALWPHAEEDLELMHQARWLLNMQSPLVWQDV